jgi:aldose 1-epimerase
MKNTLQFDIGVLLLGMLLLLPGYWVNPIMAADSGFLVEQFLIEGIPVVRLIDADREMEVSIIPSHGNRAYEMKFQGENLLYLPDSPATDFLKRVAQNGIPFMAPWANRLEEAGFWANGRRYRFNPDLKNFWQDMGGLPIHGLIMNSGLWQMVDAGADRDFAYVTSRLEFWKYPDLMAQWPFAHSYEMTYLLSGGSLEIRTTVSNLSAEAMPLIIGFHPYFRIPDIPLERWTLRLPARKKVVLDERMLPTGEFTDLTGPNPLPLEGRTLDDGYTDLEYDVDGRATFSVAADKKRIHVIFGTQYPVAQVWLPASPPGSTGEFICIEPMTGVTNGMNLSHEAKYPDLQMVPAHGSWTGSFWIRPEGF